MGIERLLGTISSFVPRNPPHFDHQEIIQQVEQTAPEVVIVDASSLYYDSGLVTRLLNCTPVLRLLLLQINSNDIQILEKRSVQIHDTGDLVSFL